MISGTFIAVTLKAYFLNEVFIQIPIMDSSTDMITQLWADGWKNRSRMEKIFEDVSKSRLCMSPSDFNYQLNPEGAVTFFNHSCLPLCEEGTASFGCMTPWESYRLIDPNKVMMYSRIVETTIFGDSHRASKTNNYFVPSTEALGVGMTIEYAVNKNKLSSTQWSLDVDTNRGYSTKDILVVFLDDHERPVGTSFKPSISLPLSKLLEMGGASMDLLDESAEEIGRNMLDGAAIPEGPIRRIVGFEIVVDVKCYNRHMHNIGVASHNGPICYLSAAVEKRQNSLEETEVVDNHGGLRHRSYSGVIVKIHCAGYLDVIDLTSIYNVFIALLVLLALPKRIMLFFVTRLLGHLSRIYRKVLLEPFNIEAELGGMAARLMMRSRQFADLQDSDRGISKEAMRNWLARTLEHRKNVLDESEVDKFLDICHRELIHFERHHWIQRYESDSHAKLLRDAVRGRVSDYEQEGDSAINIDMFSMACSSSESIEFDSVVNFFKKDRRRPLLERFFMPPALATIWQGAMDDSTSPREEGNPKVTLDMHPSPNESMGSDQAGDRRLVDSDAWLEPQSEQEDIEPQEYKTVLNQQEAKVFERLCSKVIASLQIELQMDIQHRFVDVERKVEAALITFQKQLDDIKQQNAMLAGAGKGDRKQEQSLVANEAVALGLGHATTSERLNILETFVRDNCRAQLEMKELSKHLEVKVIESLQINLDAEIKHRFVGVERKVEAALATYEKQLDNFKQLNATLVDAGTDGIKQEQFLYTDKAVALGLGQMTTSERLNRLETLTTRLKEDGDRCMKQFEMWQSLSAAHIDEDGGVSLS